MPSEIIGVLNLFGKDVTFRIEDGECIAACKFPFVGVKSGPFTREMRDNLRRTFDIADARDAK
jgi:hypothetical protein